MIRKANKAKDKINNAKKRSKGKHFGFKGKSDRAMVSPLFELGELLRMHAKRGMEHIQHRRD